jgi:effector-binding domain-containing protein
LAFASAAVTFNQSSVDGGTMMHRFIGFTITLIWVLTGAVPAMAIEEAQYDVAMQTNNFEVRYYAPHIVAETVVKGGLEDAGSKAFRLLFGYISGDNRSRRTVAMTAPVSQQANSEKIEMTAPVGQRQVQDKWVVSFMMPAAYTMETIPVPENPKVTLRQVPGRRMAAVRYSGSWSEKGYLENKARLETWIQNNGFKIVGTPLWARYNAPFTPWFLRRNEILIPIAPMPQKSEVSHLSPANSETGRR